MTKIDVFSGFLGAGKTTLIKKLISEGYKGEKIVLIENEFGEIGIDGGFLKDAGIEITEMNSGCICCSLVGDFSRALSQVVAEYHPDRILIEPSGVGKLSDVLSAVKKAELEDAEISAITCVVDAKKCKMYMKNFGEFFGDQISVAKTVVFSHTDTASAQKLEEALALVRSSNPEAIIVATPIAELTGEQLISAISGTSSHDDFQKATEAAFHEEHHHHHHDEECDCGCHGHHGAHEEGHHHHHHHHDEECDCGCHGHHGAHEEGHHHHHQHHDEECDCGCHGHHDAHEESHHHHHHHHDEECDCGCHGHHGAHEEDHHHHHHHGEGCSCGHDHHADEVFTSWGKETTSQFTVDKIEHILTTFDEDSEHCGMILRAKGIVKAEDGRWIHFDYVPGEHDIRYGSPDIVGKICVIGASISEEYVAQLFNA